MTSYVVLILALHLASAAANAGIIARLNRRLATAFGFSPRRLNASDYAFVAIVSLGGPVGVIIGAIMCEWWCVAFERK